MKAVVVYESLWGNTAAVARAIAEGIGPETRAVPTDEATGAEVAGADLVVAGAPVMGFRLPTEQSRRGAATGAGRAPSPPDLSHPSMRSWLDEVPEGHGRAAAFETRLWWSPGGSTKAILRGLGSKGYDPLGKGERFVVTGQYGPLREGELERARAWGAELAKTVS
ncbi:MAG: flavodoxin family protein [Coriobacteriia bacterium]|nr:flavodoxin family protein [Coriobacteriia bacterium]